ncbi:hypothetical protein ACFSQD_02550 [Flavihumibacter stibioxidans]|uniref:MORN repeat variant n=1 Tax=Flavihumibacter stibioxidans TaxID=1834163 RepID=A0ABR7MBN0_9BACT|nr:hypothetical protein [Flavihumibacter stibioxidans]MBC6492362.1 hypothetical protein [Flavihumibacter stibioxidans]
MRWILIITMFVSMSSFAQWKDYIIGVKGDTLNRVDLAGRKQGPWVHRYETIRGERGFEEEGEYTDDRKEGRWRKYSLMGDLLAVENFRWGFLDGQSQYFNMAGNVVREESWRAFNPDKLYDTIDVEDVMSPGNFNQVIVKNEGSSIRHGTWQYYDPVSGLINKTELYLLGKLEKGNDPMTLARDTLPANAKKIQKPKEVLDFEKKNTGKKKVKVRDGSVGY